MDNQSEEQIESQQPKRKRQKTILHLWGEFILVTFKVIEVQNI